MQMRLDTIVCLYGSIKKKNTEDSPEQINREHYILYVGI